MTISCPKYSSSRSYPPSFFTRGGHRTWEYTSIIGEPVMEPFSQRIFINANIQSLRGLKSISCVTMVTVQKYHSHISSITELTSAGTTMISCPKYGSSRSYSWSFFRKKSAMRDSAIASSRMSTFVEFEQCFKIDKHTTRNWLIPIG